MTANAEGSIQKPEILGVDITVVGINQRRKSAYELLEVKNESGLMVMFGVGGKRVVDASNNKQSDVFFVGTHKKPSPDFLTTDIDTPTPTSKTLAFRKTLSREKSKSKPEWSLPYLIASARLFFVSGRPSLFEDAKPNVRCYMNGKRVTNVPNSECDGSARPILIKYERGTDSWFHRNPCPLSRNQSSLGYFGGFSGGIGGNRTRFGNISGLNGLAMYRLPLAVGEERVDAGAGSNNPISETRTRQEAQRGLEKLLRMAVGIALFLLGCAATGWTEDWRRRKIGRLTLGFLLVFASIVAFAE